MKKLTITIVNFNGGEFLLNCLNSLSKLKSELEFDVIVLDNDSRDKSFLNARKIYPQFEYIDNKKNIGFGKAHNIALKKAKTPFVLTLNPDCEVASGTLTYVLEYMEKNSNVGIASVKVIKADGTLDIACHRGFPTPKASFQYFFLKNDKEYHLTNRDMNSIHEIDSGVGAFLFIRRSVLTKVGYFDEDYFLYGEDIDLCYRVKHAGFKIMYLPHVQVLHIKGISSGIKKESVDSSGAEIETKKASVNYFNEVMSIFYKKHYAKKYPVIFNWFVYLGIYFKSLMIKIKKTV